MVGGRWRLVMLFALLNIGERRSWVRRDGAGQRGTGAGRGGAGQDGDRAGWGRGGARQGGAGLGWVGGIGRVRIGQGQGQARARTSNSPCVVHSVLHARYSAHRVHTQAPW